MIKTENSTDGINIFIKWI